VTVAVRMGATGRGGKKLCRRQRCGNSTTKPRRIRSC
jgi:hypothetical protein